MGALLGDDVIIAEAGELAFKPRDQWHTFWNAGDEPCRILEIISPGGFEHFFHELGAMVEPQMEQIAELGARYGHYFDMEGTARVAAEHGLRFPPLEQAESRTKTDSVSR